MEMERHWSTLFLFVLLLIQKQGMFHLGLDFAISEANRHGIKLVLSLVNNYDQYGGKKQYVNWARNQGQSISSDDEFFSNSVVKDYYKNHIKNILNKPVLFAEFGKSAKTSPYDQRDELFDKIYSAIYSSASSGGAAAGGLFWQLLTEGMDSYRDGYEVIFSENPSTASIVSQQSQKLNRIRKMYARLRNVEKLTQERGD
ncbi:hypothetical protein HS088_TW06G01312 [Tripterygium wilfordii]|uniref:mannan endo-1,4-beta-mannosidase n=1 Tax=Tripterygium wilfordii TaxID=458696 RepID=A0A7J7DLB5_TRIWF|nr:hypothetical protein HS088_TW06G01312 [Tripterygium wilfordii]